MSEVMDSIVYLRSFIIPIRTIHWSMTILKNYGVSLDIINHFKHAEVKFIASISDHPMFQLIYPVTVAEVDRLYNMDQDLIDYEPESDDEQEHCWVEHRQNISTYKTIYAILDALEIAITMICRCDPENKGLDDVKLAIIGLDNWINRIDIKPLPKDLVDFLKQL